MGYVENVNTIASNIDTLVNLGTSVDAVVSNEENIIIAADNIDTIISVAGNEANINLVADNSTAIIQAGSNIPAITTVNANEANINLVADNEANINLVATNIDNVNSVGNNIDDVVAVAQANVDIISDDLSGRFTYSDDLGSITDPTEADNGDSKIANVSDNITEIIAVGSNIANVNSVGANTTNINIVAADIDNVNTAADNLADIQAAPIAATNAQLRAWEAEAKKRTADSYATEDEDVFVKIWSSNGDGTFSFVNSTDYSAYHWKGKAEAVASTDALLKANNLSDIDDINIAKVNLGIDNIDNTSDIDKPISEAAQIQFDILNTSISNLATASGSVSGVQSGGYIFDPIPDTFTTIPIVVDKPSSDTEVFEVNEDNTITFKKNASYNIYRDFVVESNTNSNSERIFEFRLVNVADNTVVASKNVSVKASSGSVLSLSVVGLVTVGRNGIPNAPITLRSECREVEGDYSMVSLHSIISSSSSYDISTQASGISFDNTASGISATNVQDALLEALNLDLGGLA